MLTKDPYLSDKDFRFIVQDIGPQLVPYLSVEERLTGLSLEEMLAGRAPEEIEAYLKRVKSQSPSNGKNGHK